MRNYCLVFFTVLIGTITTASAKNIYIAANGNNANNGLSASAPWQSISKLNASFGSIAPGDSVLFRRGDTFYGAIVIGKSGSSGKPINFGAYGTGAKPIITGFKKLTSWTLVSTGIYQCPVPGVKTTLNMVTLNNKPQALGRYPNADATNGGYLTYESFSGYKSITDNQLTSTKNWTGADVVIRKTLYVLDRCKVTAHSGGTLTYTNSEGSTYNGMNNYGYFIQNDIRTLDKLGEWYLNKSTKYLQMYFGTASPSSYTVKASTLDTLLTINSKSYINFINIAFEGANNNTIYAANSNYINFRYCDISNAGKGAIYTQTVSNLLIENCTTNNVLNNAIDLRNSSASNTTIRSCSIKNTATLPGMAPSGSNSYKGIYASVLSNLLMEYNTVDTTGYVALQFQGSNVTIQKNVVNYFDFVLDDAGGIYSYTSGTDANPGTNYTNRVVQNNIVMNGKGAPNGRSTATLFATGIYMDGRTMNVKILNNTVFNNGKNGIHCNNPNYVTVTGNTSFNNLNAMSVARWSWGSVKSLVVKNNIFYPKVNTQRGFYYTNTALNEPTATSLNSALTALGNIDSNTYSMINPTNFNFEIYGTTGGAGIPTSPLSLEGWRANSTHDMHGKKPAKLPVEYLLGSLVGSNKFTNGAFTSNISGLTVFGSNVAGSWDNTGKISGGALKVSFTSPAANKYTVIHSPIGAVSSSKKYILRFTTYGTTAQGIVRAYIRKTASPYDNLVATQTKTFATGKTSHEFLFNAPTSATGGSFVIELEQNSGTTYIDNVSFYEATATIYDVASQIRFEYNATKAAKTIALGASYTAINGTIYSSSVTLQPFTSIILVKNLSITAARTAEDSTIVLDSLTTTQQDIISTVDTAAIVKPLLQRSADENNRPLLLNAFPNPSPNEFNLVLEGGSKEKVTVVVYSFDGKLMYQTTGYSNNRFAFGSNFMAGTYIVRVIQGNISQTLKLIKAGN